MKIICIGRNYAKHIAELQNEKPLNPVIFLKPDSAILIKNQPFFIPPFSKEMVLNPLLSELSFFGSL